jgi:hypothetical protein
MRFIPLRGTFHLRTLALVCSLAVLLFFAGVGFGPRTPVAHAAAKTARAACTYYYALNNKYGFWDAAYWSVGDTNCGAFYPHGYGELHPCSGVNVTANMDVWLSQATDGSGRVAESGRTGNETWAPDCNYWYQVQVIGWGQYGWQPLWACLWTYDSTVNLSFDKLCAQDY